MQYIKDLFRKDIYRKIEEVIKVDQHDEGTVKNEIQEYVATPDIKDHFCQVYNAVAEYPSEPHEGIGIWVSGFFGSGKSSFAKILGYTLANRKIISQSASQWFIENVRDKQITNYLQNINSRFPIHAIIFDVSMDRGVRTASEQITEIMYKALLRELGYAEDFDLAELEITLEAKGRLDEFVSLFNKEYSPATWEEERDMAMGISYASAVLHKMMPDVFPREDSWSNSLGTKKDSGDFIGRADITPNKLAERAFGLMAKRKPEAGLVFIIDEVGQYVSRSVQKMLDLQAVVQAFGKESKNRFKARQIVAPCWIVVTSQEKLNEVVDAMEGRVVELARLQDRFPTTIDLKQSDIQEVTAKRVLEKKDAGWKKLSELFDKNEGHLKTYCKLERTSRDTTVTKEDFINLYPYLPYQIELCIDIVAGLRLKRGAQKHIGGSNRTIIKQAQQMLIHPRTNIADQETGNLVTLDKVYELLYAGNLLPVEVTREVDGVARHIHYNEMALKVTKAIVLLEAVKDLPRTAHNIAVVLHPSVNSGSILNDVKDAITKLEKAQIIRASEEGYKLLTVQEKNWDTERASLAPKPKQRSIIKQEIIKEIFSAPKTRTYNYKGMRTFRVGLFIDGEKVEEGDIPLSIHIADNENDFKEKIQQLCVQSRQDSHRNEVFWVFLVHEDIHRLIEEKFRSNEMIATYSRIRAQNQISPEQSACLEDEKQRENRIHQDLRSKITKVTESGSGLFRGVEKDGSELGNSISEIITGMLDSAVPELYPKLEIGARKIKGDEPEKILTTANLKGLPSIFYDKDDGLNLVVKHDNKYQPNINAEIAQEILNYIKNEHSYGTKVTGNSLEEHFKGFDYGWEGDILRLVLAVLFRGGAIEVTHQGVRHRGYSDPDARLPFTNNRAFKSATFAPRETLDLKMRADAAKHYEEITGNEVNIEEEAIAFAFKKLAEEDKEILLPLQERTNALGLPVKDTLSEFRQTIDSVLNSEIDDCVKILAGEGKSYKESREKIRRLAEALSDEDMKNIQNAKSVLIAIMPLLEKLGLDGEVHEKAETLRKALNSDNFYDELESIRLNTQGIYAVYRKAYSDKHNQRKEMFEKAIESVKGHVKFALLDKDMQDSLLTPFIERCCNTAILKDTSACEKCRATIEQMDSDVLAIQGMKDNAVRQIEKLTDSGKIEYLRVSEIISGYIEKEEDVEIALQKIKEKIMKMLAEGYKISFQ